MRSDTELALCALVREAPGVATGADDAVVACAREHRLHLVVAQRTARADLAADLRAAAAVDAARQRELGRTLAALAAGGVRAVCIKGAALAHTHYPRPEMRPRLDTDLLIAAGAREDAGRVLASLGYRRPVETEGDLCTSQIHWTRADGAGIDHQLDVHWRISNVLAFAGVLTCDDVERRAVPLPPLGAAALAPCPIHSLLIACIHRVAHHRDSANLLWLYDVSLIANTLDAAARAEFAALAAERQVRAVCASSLRRAADAFGGAASDLAREIAPPAGSRREPTAALLSSDLRLVDVLAADMRALDTWLGRVQLVREHVFPSRQYMVARYGADRPLAWRYLQRIASGAPKWFRSRSG